MSLSQSHENISAQLNRKRLRKGQRRTNRLIRSEQREALVDARGSEGGEEAARARAPKIRDVGPVESPNDDLISEETRFPNRPELLHFFNALICESQFRASPFRSPLPNPYRAADSGPRRAHATLCFTDDRPEAASRCDRWCPSAPSVSQSRTRSCDSCLSLCVAESLENTDLAQNPPSNCQNCRADSEFVFLLNG
jgi:hypothetical protein